MRQIGLILQNVSFQSWLISANKRVQSISDTLNIINDICKRIDNAMNVGLTADPCLSSNSFSKKQPP